MKVLVINAGSSSLKYQLMDPETGKVFAKGLCERIGLDGKFTYKPQVEGKETIKAADVAMPTHSEAIQTVLNALVDPQNGVISSMKEIDAVGHRVVHGGETFASSVLINDEVLKAVEDCTPLAPLHNPANIIGIEACRKVLGKDPKDLKIVSCHLGNGSSLAAVDGGKCVDTSMGLTPLAGLPMGTRAGDMDVGVIEYVANKYDRSISSVMEGLNKRSGMMGLSGVSSDFRDLEAAAAKGHHRSAIALRIFEYRVHKMIAEYAAAMNGVDVVVFTAGVGENAPSTRAHILEGLEFMGITCDEEKNDVRGEERIISKDGAPVTVMVIPTNEELMIAQDTLSIVEENKNK